jgi:hypothetical protein
MILGRSTVQWTALIVAAAGLVQVMTVTLTELDPTVVATILGAATSFLSVFIAFLANTRTTPINDPVLSAGTSVSVKGSEDKVVIQPSPPGPTGIEGSGD